MLWSKTVVGTRSMAAWRRAIELALAPEDVVKLASIARSRTEPASRVERARMLLAYRDDPSFFAVGRALGVHHQTVQRCIDGASLVRDEERATGGSLSSCCRRAPPIA